MIIGPVELNKASGLLCHDVPHRGRAVIIAANELRFGDEGLASAWQSDNAGINQRLSTTVRLDMQAVANHYLQVPVAKNADGSAVTDSLIARIINRCGTNAQPLIVQANPVPYMPTDLDTTKTSLVSREH